jgi:hypothetical protein
MGVTGRIELREFFLERLYELSREQRVWIPGEVGAYLAQTMVNHFDEASPSDLSGMLEQLRAEIPKDRIERFDHLRMMGDKIVYFHIIADISSCVATINHARMYYDDAAAIGKKLREPAAPVLEKIAEDLPDYEDVLRQLRRVA